MMFNSFSLLNQKFLLIEKGNHDFLFSSVLSQKTTTTKCRFFFTTPSSLLQELISIWLTESCWISTCDQSLWSTQWGLQAASTWKPGRSGGGQERGNVCTLLVLWLFHGGPPLNGLCRSRIVFIPAGVPSCSGLCGICWYPGFPLRWLQDSGDFSSQMWSLTALPSVSPQGVN